MNKLTNPIIVAFASNLVPTKAEAAAAEEAIIADASRGQNYMLAAIVACGRATEAERAEAKRLTDPTRTKQVNAHDNLVAALKVAQAPQVIVKATAPKAATKTEQVRTLAREQAPKGKYLVVVNTADRLLADHPKYGAKRAVSEAIGLVNQHVKLAMVK